ncbi:MAG: cbb3-type cytochrome oxidase assembly protein CcoS [Cyclobacteriaceae bacterium]|nr:cbb3-type cytochrome oxidase assembly protein CcoS [Cyclobacteriaceae bacterium]
MDIIIPLIFISLIIAVGFLIAFIWNIRSGQYSDTYTPSVRILFGDSTQNEKKKSALSPDPVKK